MTVTDFVTTDIPADGPPPIWDTEHLLRRINALAPERQAELAESWAWNHLPALGGCVTADAYRKMENVLSCSEVTVGVGGEEAREVRQCALRFDALPAFIQPVLAEQFSVYAGGDIPGHRELTTTGRLNEWRRLLAEAEDYARDVAAGDTPSVADLPPADDTADQISSSEYPGPKADAKTVLAWVGDSRDKAARAYAHEQDRSSPRKGVTAKLEGLLGEEGLLRVQEAMARATPPPMDLSATPTPTPPVASDLSAVPPAFGAVAAASEATVETGVEGPALPPGAESSGELRTVTVDAAPSAPTLAKAHYLRVAGLHRQLADAYSELVEVMA